MQNVLKSAIKKPAKAVLKCLGIEYGRQKYPSAISVGETGNERLLRRMNSGHPLMVSRLGSGELSCISYFLRHRQRRKSKPYPTAIRDTMSTNGGFFPTGDELLDRFSEMFLGHIRDVNMMGVWYNRDEDWVLRKYCAEAELVELSCLEPFRFAEPWSSTLAGRVVLVVHPFTDSITQQYSEKRALLFDNPNVLPLFELKTVRAVQSIVNTQVDFETWFDAYEFMCREIEKCEFDTAIIGAGPYGLPLASFVKRLGKTAIHLGGVTQVLFGVMGRRWETAYANSIGKLFNEHWVRPNSSETPAEYKNVEDGCYW